MNLHTYVTGMLKICMYCVEEDTIIFDTIMAFSTSSFVRLGFNICSKFVVSQSFQAINLKLCTDITGILKMYM